VPLRVKFILGMNLYTWICLPLCTSNILLAGVAPVPLHPVVSFLLAFVGAANLYMYPCGFLRSFSLKELGWWKTVACFFGIFVVIPLNIVVENIAVIWGVFGYKYKFYVVRKEANGCVNAARHSQFTV
jgi:egghead protein (zeste-white 4 protein)